MNPRLLLKAMVSLMLIPSLVCLFLPDTIARSYTKIMFPLVLLIGAVLSIKVASNYKKWLRKAFIFLSLFSLFMMLAHIDTLWVILRAVVGSSFPKFLLIMQWTTYAMLVICSFYILKVTELREIGVKGWVAIIAVLSLGGKAHTIVYPK